MHRAGIECEWIRTSWQVLFETYDNQVIDCDDRKYKVDISDQFARPTALEHIK